MNGRTSTWEYSTHTILLYDSRLEDFTHSGSRLDHYYILRNGKSESIIMISSEFCFGIKLISVFIKSTRKLIFPEKVALFHPWYMTNIHLSQCIVALWFAEL